MLEKCESLGENSWKVRFQNWRMGLRNKIDDEIDLLKGVFEVWRMERQENIFDLTECEEHLGL